MEKNIRNTDAVTCKLGPVSIKANNQKLEFAKKKRRKREEIVERQKTKAMVAKCQELEEELVHLVKKRRIMRVTLKMK